MGSDVKAALITLLAALTSFVPSAASADSSCLYMDSASFIRQVPRLEDVPREYREKAKCGGSSEDAPIADPKEVELTGALRSSSFSTDLGRMDVRWQRKTEECFSKSPEIGRAHV